MTKFNFNDNEEKVAKEYNLDAGQYFKLQEGKNRIRLVSVCLPHQSEYKGQPTFKWLCQVLDRTDGKIKPFFMSRIIYTMIGDLQLDPDYMFDSVPMPYDITINATGAGNKDVKYSVIPAPTRAVLSPNELAAIAEAPTVEEVQAKLKEHDAKQEVPKAGEPGRPIDFPKAGEPGRPIDFPIDAPSAQAYDGEEFLSSLSNS